MSDFFPWISAFSTGIESVDSQHKRLVEMLNAIFTELSTKQDERAVGRILEEMLDYANMHFEMEEELMRESGYPNFDKHKKTHDAFLKKTNALRKKLRDNKAVVTIEVAQFLKDWLKDHIMRSDKEFVPFTKKDVVKSRL